MAANKSRTKFFECDKCNYSTVKKSNLKRHYKETHGLDEQNVDKHFEIRSTISCHLCEHKTYKKSKLIDHLNSLHFCEIRVENESFDSLAGNYKLTFAYFIYSSPVFPHK